ncbi:MAG: hypothetical protein KDK39_14355 [Leptospiraceae bacterium]|nr:hypothetical protein [Leptospiraceae bacterium]
MDRTAELIAKVEANEYNIVRISTNAGRSYEVDLSGFKKVYCYPTKDEWSRVSIDSYGLDLVWPGRFEVHVDQILAVAQELSSVKEI